MIWEKSLYCFSVIESLFSSSALYFVLSLVVFTAIHTICILILWMVVDVVWIVGVCQITPLRGTMVGHLLRRIL